MTTLKATSSILSKQARRPKACNFIDERAKLFAHRKGFFKSKFRNAFGKGGSKQLSKISGLWRSHAKFDFWQFDIKHGYKFNPHTDVWRALNTQYIPECCKKDKKSQCCYSGGIRTHDLCRCRTIQTIKPFARQLHVEAVRILLVVGPTTIR